MSSTFFYNGQKKQGGFHMTQEKQHDTALARDLSRIIFTVSRIL